MEGIRKPFQGVLNIIRFNWHFYLISIVLLILIITLEKYIPESFILPLRCTYLLMSGTIFISLIVSYYVYDYSDLYKLSWLPDFGVEDNCEILTINAGFDETSELLSDRFKQASITVMDFYDSAKHTEISIKRARKIYQPFPGTLSVRSEALPLKNNSKDIIFVIFSAHEIRNNKERLLFFSELGRVVKSNGRIVVTEHLRDIPNFIAYTIGFFHFYSGASWRRIVNEAGLVIERTIKITPFVTTFIIQKNGITS